MCVCACASVSVCLPIKGDSRFGDSLDSCCLLCSLRGDEQMVCWSVVRRTHAGHTPTRKHKYAHACSILSPQLYPPFIFSITRLSAGQCHSVSCGVGWEGSGGALVCMCVWERQKKDTRQCEWSHKPSLWGGHLKKLMTHSHIGFLWIIAIHPSAALYSARIAWNGGIVFFLLICPRPGNKTRHI